MRKSGEKNRRWIGATAAVLVALVLACSVVLIIFSSISSSSSRYTTSESYTGTVIAGDHDNHSSEEWTNINSMSLTDKDDKTYVLSEEGNYYLSGDLNGNIEILANKGDDDEEDPEFTICLNGHMILGTGTEILDTDSSTDKNDDGAYDNYGTVIMVGREHVRTNNDSFTVTLNLYDCGGDALTEHYYKCATEKIEYARNTYVGDEVVLDAVYYDFDVSEDEIAEIKAGTREGGCVVGGVVAGGRTPETGSNNNYGGGVSVENGSTFNMYGGTIAGNETSNSGSGGVYVYDGSFNMYGGTIEGNCSTYNSSDYNRYGGGGVAVADGSSFTMHDGVISNNCALCGGGVKVDAVSGDASFEMRGGSISDNRACLGGGVSEYGASGHKAEVVISGGTIENNAAEGYFSQQVTNQVPNGEYLEHFGYGGGVYVTNPGANFKMTGGKITGNTQTNPESGCDGAGLYLANCAEGGFVLGDDAYIYGNYKYVTDKDTGDLISTTACNLGYDSNFNTDNSNNYQTKQLVLESALSNDALIGITFNDAEPAADTPVKFTYADTSDSNLSILQSSYGRFSSDEGYNIEVNETGGYLQLVL